ncbi:protocadherin beta-10 isoform X2 [Astyanax mexicanus]|uniref:Cadherin domain-containing protein n=1 Tax=Astyanax mexicanus TaxID=7994 RepID=A0A8B9HDN8_ASTMX|nr:protocadherin beta-10 isoform X2 [Astyanax mexicanus]
MKSNRLVIIRDIWRTLLLYYLLSPSSHLTESASECEGGQDVFAAVRENSPKGEFIANLTITGDPSANHISLSLAGVDADWFVLEGKTVRLNSNLSQVLDREVHGSVLMATVSCYEDGALQREHRITVEILDNNDNKPEFLQSTIQPIEISELTAMNSTVLMVEAKDADGDTLIFGIDETSPDASYFRMDLPNSGQVILNRTLDYETKTQLQLTLYAMEMNTIEHYNTTATITINVTDGDDQYPQFQPCTLLSISQGSPICANPLYTVNITEQDEDIVLDFSPGPVNAVDGDEGLRTPLTYAILSGADNGRFVIHSESGEVRLTRRVENRLLTPTLRLRIMAAQSDDPMKYSVATALVRVLAENRFPPQFSRSAYRGFVSESTSPASLVNTYGNELLVLEATDQDFTDGFNPKLQYSLSSDSNSSHFYYITQEGLLIAKANQLQPNHKHSLEVLATDQESGDVVRALIDIDVLQKGVPVPQGPLEEGQPQGRGTVGRTGGVVGLCLILLAIALFVLVYFIKRKRERQDPANRASVAEGKHPNVVNHGRSHPLVEEVFYHNEAFSGFDASTSTLHGQQGSYTKTEPDSGAAPQQKVNTTPDASTPTEDVFPTVKTNGKPLEKTITKSVSFQDFVEVRECESHGDDDRDRSDSTGLEDISIDLSGISSIPDELESISVGSEQTNTESMRDFEILNADRDMAREAQEKAGQNIGNQDVSELLGVKTAILQEDKADDTAYKDANKAETSKSLDLSTSQSDSVRPVMVNPDVSEKEAEIPDAKLSSSGGPTTSAPQITNKNLESSGTGSGLQTRETETEEGNADIKIIVTLTDSDDANSDSATEDTGEQVLNIRDAAPDSPQLRGTRAEETKASNKDPNMQTDSEDIATSLDNMNQDGSNPPPQLNPDLNKPATNHADLSHLVAHNSDTNIQT